MREHPQAKGWIKVGEPHRQRIKPTLMEVIGIVLIAVIALFIYFIPSWIGWNKRNSDAIIAVNFFFGWTALGWFIALIWALTNESVPVPIVQKPVQETKPDKFDQLKKLKALLDEKAISIEEYETEKQKLLNEPLQTEWRIKK